MKKIAFQQKKCQVLKNFRIDCSQNLTIFLLERDLFHGTDQIFGQYCWDFGLERNVPHPSSRILEFGRRLKNSFRTQKFVKILKMAYLKNGLRSAVAIYMAEIRPLLGFGG